MLPSFPKIDPRILAILKQFPGAQQTPGAQPGDMAQPAVAAQAPPPEQPDARSLIQKIQMGIPAGIRSARDAVMPEPTGLAGLLSPDDVGSARGRGVLDFGLSMLANATGQNGGNAPSLGQALQAGVGAARSGYKDTMDTTIGNRMTGLQLGTQAHILQARQAIGKFLEGHMNGDMPTQMGALRQAYMMAAAVGDHETMKTLSPLLEKDPGLLNKEPQVVPAGGRSVLLDPITHQPIGVIPHTATPMSDDTRDFRQGAADARNESIAMRRDQQAAQREARMVSQYEVMTKPFAQAAINVQALNENRHGAMLGDPVAQQTALQDFIKLNLPGQMVTAGELHQYASLMGLGDKGAQLLQKLEHGTPLSTQQMRLIYQHADGLVAERRKAANYLRKQMQARGAKYNIDPEAFVDHFGFLDDAPVAPAATGAAAVDRHLRKDY
jgi:hypothetical protein